VGALPVEDIHQMFAKGVILIHKAPQKIVFSFQFLVGRSQSATKN
jgi:hypothetical protein